MGHKVFVYGSLMIGLGNHGFLARSSFIGNDTTTDKDFRMMSYGAFPGVVRSTEDSTGAVVGELYDVDNATLRALDRLEGNGHFYTRELVELESGETAWMYILPGEDRLLVDWVDGCCWRSHLSQVGR